MSSKLLNSELSMQCLPNLIVAGVQKSGTTWLHERLALHPDIYMSKPKELNFFSSTPADRIGAELSSYSKYFERGGEKKYRGESSVGYFWSGGLERKTFRNENIPLSMKEHLSNQLKTIVILRNPIERALSAYLHHIRAGRFGSLEGIHKDGQQFGILDIGHYKRHVESWLEVFPRESVLFFSFDDILNDANTALARVHTWLGLSEQNYADSEVPKNIGLGWSRIDDELVVPTRALNKLFKQNNENSGVGVFPRVTKEEILSLQELYSEDISFVSKELFPCEHWKELDLNEFPPEPSVDQLSSLKQETEELKRELKRIEAENTQLEDIVEARLAEIRDHVHELERLRADELNMRMQLEKLSQSRFTQLGVAVREMRSRFSLSGGDEK